jgi:tetratricopeptide (TPR) repeat protein
MREAIESVSENVKSSASSVASSVQGAAQSVQGAAQDAQPKMREAIESVSEDVKSSASSVAGSVKGATQDAQPKMKEAIESVSEDVKSSASSVADSVKQKTQDTSSTSSIDTSASYLIPPAEPIDLGIGTIEDTQPAIADSTLIGSSASMTSAPIIPEQQPIYTGSAMTDSSVSLYDDQMDMELIQSEFDRGIMLSNQGDLVGAEAAFEHVTQLIPESAEARFNLGVVQYQQGRLPEAIANIQQARDLSLLQGSVDAAENLDRIIQQLRAASW